MSMWLLLLSSILVMGTPGHAPPQVADAPPAVEGLEGDLEILDKLDALTLSADYADVRLDDVVADLSTRLPAPMLIDPEPLRTIGVIGVDRVTLQSGPVPASALLDALTRALASGLDQPTWEVHGGTIVLTSEDGTEALRSLAIYDVRDLVDDDSLLGEIKSPRPVPHATSPVDSPDAAAKDDEEPASTAEGYSLLPPSRAHDLLIIILEHLDPDAWVDMGGSLATISDHNGLVMVTAPTRLHRKFRDALRRLRDAQAVSVRMVLQVLDMPSAEFAQLSRQYPHEGQLAVALSRSSDATVKWESQGTVAMGSTLALSSIGENKEVSVDVKADYDRPTGRVQLEIKALMIDGKDRREADTNVEFQLGEGAAILQLAPTEPTETVRVLIVRPM